jgi:hypothetical protein
MLKQARSSTIDSGDGNASHERTHARLHRLPDLPLIVVPSDYLDRSDEAVAAKLTPLIDEIVGKLCGGGT